MKNILACVALLLAMLPMAHASQEDADLYYMVDPPVAYAFDQPGIEIWDSFSMEGQEVIIASIAPALGPMVAGSDSRWEAVPPSAPGEALYIVSSRRGMDVARLSDYGEIILWDEHTALVRADRKGAAAIAGQGMELKRVLPPSGRAPSSVARVSPGTRQSWDPTVQEIINKVDQASLWNLLGSLSGESEIIIGGEPYTILTRFSFSGLPVQKATQYAYDYFSGLGLSVTYQDYSLDGYELRNIIAEQRGNVHPENIYIACAHLDDMPKSGRAPGADDNASGCAAVFTAASILSKYTLENTVRYVLFTGEEQGMEGSYSYVRELAARGENMLGALNMDMIAYDSDSSPAVEVHCGDMPASGTLGDYWIDTVSRYSLPLAPRKYTSDSIGYSDHERFWDAGYNALLLIEDGGADETGDFNPYYHTAEDTRAHCNPVYLTACTKATTGTLARLAVPVGATVVPTLALEGTPDNPVTGSAFTLRLRVARDIVRPFDFYCVFDSPYGVYTLFLDGNFEKGIQPLYQGVPGYAAPAEVTIWNNVTVPPGIAGTFTFYAVATDAGMIPPVASLGELTDGTPYVAAFSKKQVLFSAQ